MLYQLEILQIVAFWVLTPRNYFSIIFSYISSTLQMERACLSETSVPKCQNPKSYNLKHYHVNMYTALKIPECWKLILKNELCVEAEGVELIYVVHQRYWQKFWILWEKFRKTWFAEGDSQDKIRRSLCPLEVEVQVYMCCMAIW
jgi:hypothetical protein